MEAAAIPPLPPATPLAERVREKVTHVIDKGTEVYNQVSQNERIRQIIDRLALNRFTVIRVVISFSYWYLYHNVFIISAVGGLFFFSQRVQEIDEKVAMILDVTHRTWQRKAVFWAIAVPTWILNLGTLNPCIAAYLGAHVTYTLYSWSYKEFTGNDLSTLFSQSQTNQTPRTLATDDKPRIPSFS